MKRRNQGGCKASNTLAAKINQSYARLASGIFTMKLRSFTQTLNIQTHGIVALISILLLNGCTAPPDKPQSMQVLPECGWLPNCVNTQSDQGEQSSQPISANAEQWEKIKLWISGQQDWEVTVNNRYFIQAIVKTPLMRFRDDVQLLFIPDAQLIHVRSSSRLGISDMGVNAQRVETIRQMLHTKK